MVSAINEVEVAVQAIKDGAYHYINKEFDYDALRSLVRNALQRQDLSRRVVSLRAQVADQNEREFVLGPSQVMREIVTMVKKVADLPATVLILGESGTGRSCWLVCSTRSRDMLTLRFAGARHLGARSSSAGKPSSSGR